jgi:hypothetical protein
MRKNHGKSPSTQLIINLFSNIFYSEIIKGSNFSILKIEKEFNTFHPGFQKDWHENDPCFLFTGFSVNGREIGTIGNLFLRNGFERRIFCVIAKREIRQMDQVKVNFEIGYFLQFLISRFLDCSFSESVRFFNQVWMLKILGHVHFLTLFYKTSKN